VPQHVLRFWETKFAFIRPMKRAGGRRFYRPSDIAVLRGVRRLLHDEGYTIKGVQKLHREQGVRRLVSAGEGEAVRGPASPWPPPATSPPPSTTSKPPRNASTTHSSADRTPTCHPGFGAAKDRDRHRR
jgi:DNA-binding transcriptional MerR regulator